MLYIAVQLAETNIIMNRLASHSLFSDWTGAGEKGLVTLGYSFCLYQNLGRDYSLIFPRDPKIA